MKMHGDMAATLQQQVQFEMAAAKFRYDEEHKYQDLVNSFLSNSNLYQDKHLKNYFNINEQLSKVTYGFGKYTELLSAAAVIMINIFDVFEKFDKAAADFRMEMGFTRAQAGGIRSEAEQIAINFQNVGVNIKGAYEAFSSLGEAAGSVYTVTYDMVKTTALLKSQLGVSEENSAGFMRNMAAISKSTMQSQQDMSYVAADMSQAAGIPLNQVMSDVGKATGVTLSMMSRIPNEVLRSAIELRRMGTSLNEAASSSREILNFSDNINAEMEASVLLGRSINLQRARELAYRRDLEGSTKEILRITKSISFENLDVFQQEAFAKATGKSVDELLHMVQAERQWNAARRDPTLSGKVEAYERLHKSVEAETKARGENLRLMIEQSANQDRLTSISNKWNQLITQAGAVLLPIIDGMLSLVVPAMDIAEGIFAWTAGLKSAFAVVTVFGKYFTFFGRIMYEVIEGGAKIEGVLLRVGGIFVKFGQYLSPLLKFLGIFGGTFGKAIPILGEVIMAFQFIWNFSNRLYKIWNDPNMSPWEKIKAGLWAVAGALYDTLIKPFKDAWSWIHGLWGGHSPSKLGMSILKGIVSIGPMLFDALTAPFRHGLAWIANKIPGMSKFVDSSFVPSSTIISDGRNISGKGKSTPTTVTVDSQKDEPKDNTLHDILLAINNLNTNLTSGRIGIYLDGQLVSATLAGQTEFRGGYGVNKI
jgi:flagellar hook-basal body complex protein FliE